MLTAQAMPAPPKGNQYEVWLTGVEERLSLGIPVIEFKPQRNPGFFRKSTPEPDRQLRPC